MGTKRHSTATFDTLRNFNRICLDKSIGSEAVDNNRDNNRKQPIQQQIATDTTAGSNREESREQPILQQIATDTTAGSNREESSRQIDLS